MLKSLKWCQNVQAGPNNLSIWRISVIIKGKKGQQIILINFWGKLNDDINFLVTVREVESVETL